MKIYIAGPYPLREEAILVMTQLEAKGHTITSRWLRAPEELVDGNAKMDLQDVADADMLLALNFAGWEERGTGGRHVELGYALALGKQITLVGQRSNIFHYHSDVRVIERVEDL